MHTDTKILPVEFNYARPGSLAEALRLLDQYGARAKVLAGGTDLLVKMKTGGVRPEYVIEIKQLKELDYIREEGGLRIGAATTLSRLLAHRAVKERYSALFEAVRSMAAVAVRNMGTLGGNLCNASPAADTAPPLLVYGARVRLARLAGEREVPLEDFFLGPGRTVMEPSELLVEVYVPDPGENSGASFLKLARVAADIAKINVAVWLKRDGKTCAGCRIAFGAVAERPIRAEQAERVLEGREITADVLREAAEAAAGELRPITDNRSTAEYRREVSRVLLEEAVRAAWQRAGGGAV